MCKKIIPRIHNGGPALRCSSCRAIKDDELQTAIEDTIDVFNESESAIEDAKRLSMRNKLLRQRNQVLLNDNQRLETDNQRLETDNQRLKQIIKDGKNELKDCSQEYTNLKRLLKKKMGFLNQNVKKGIFGGIRMQIGRKFLQKNAKKGEKKMLIGTKKLKNNITRSNNMSNDSQFEAIIEKNNFIS